MNTSTNYGKPSARVIAFPSSGRVAGANAGAAAAWMRPATEAPAVSELSSAWPFERLHVGRIHALARADLLRLEGAWIYLADQLGFALARPGRCLNGGAKVIQFDRSEWPFERLDNARVCLLEPADLVRLEMQWIWGAQQLGLSLETDAAPASVVEPSVGMTHEYLWWGELIYGTKARIQALGIAEGRAFPGEVGGPRRVLNVKDPRGFETSISIQWSFDGGRHATGFWVSISYPGRKLAGPEWLDAAPGVRVCKASPWVEEFVGTAEALVASGLLREGQFPGLADMRRVRVRIAPDGAVMDGPPTQADARSKMAGSKCVEKAGVSAWRVQVVVSDEVAELRRELQAAKERAEIAAFERMPRPPALASASHLRLV